MFAQMQIPESYNPDHAISHPHGHVGVIDVFLFRPHDDGHVKRDAVHVDDDTEHAVEHAHG